MTKLFRICYKVEFILNFTKLSCLEINFFMSVFNVHVNRIPFSGKIAKIRYFPIWCNHNNTNFKRGIGNAYDRALLSLEDQFSEIVKFA